MNITFLMDLFLHLDRYLGNLLNQYPVMAYAALFLVIFIETGLVITPFLPGDSLIFATGAIAAARGIIPIPFVLLLLYVAAVGGDTVNYHIGHLLRDKVRKKEHIPLIREDYLQRTENFFERHGGKTITIARFIPIIRTFAPFVAGTCRMPYLYFLKYNVVGGLMWVSLLFSLGYFFGNIEYVKNHFGLVVIAIVVISVLPAVFSLVRSKIAGKDKGKGEADQ